MITTRSPAARINRHTAAWWSARNQRISTSSRRKRRFRWRWGVEVELEVELEVEAEGEVVATVV